MTFTPDDAAEVVAVIEARLAELAELPVSEIDDDLRLDDAGIDSLALMSLLVDVEEVLGSEIPVETLELLDEVETLGALKEVVRRAMATTSATRPGGAQ